MFKLHFLYKCFGFLTQFLQTQLVTHFISRFQWSPFWKHVITLIWKILTMSICWSVSAVSRSRCRILTAVYKMFKTSSPLYKGASRLQFCTRVRILHLERETAHDRPTNIHYKFWPNSISCTNYDKNKKVIAFALSICLWSKIEKLDTYHPYYYQHTMWLTEMLILVLHCIRSVTNVCKKHMQKNFKKTWNKFT